MKLGTFLRYQLMDPKDQSKALKKIIHKLEKKAARLEAAINDAKSSEEEKKLKRELALNQQHQQKAKVLLDDLKAT